MSAKPTIGVLAFDFGRPVSAKINPHSIGLYKYIGSLFGSVGEPKTPDTVPISWQITNHQISVANADVIADRVEKIANHEIIVIDLTHSKNNGLTLQVERNFVSVLSNVVDKIDAAYNREGKVLYIVISAEPLDFDFHYRDFREKFVDGNIINISLDGAVAVPVNFYIGGDVKYAETFRNDFKFSEFVECWMPHAELRDRISKKVIKHPGIYEYHSVNGDNKTEAYYFDGSECGDEVKKYISLTLSRHTKFDSCVRIVCISGVSHWFDKDIIPQLEIFLKKVHSHRGSVPDIVVNTLEKDLANWEAVKGYLEEDSNIVVLVPYVGTGETATEIIKRLNQKSFNHPILLMSVMQRQGFEQSIFSSSSKHEVKYEPMTIVEDNHRNIHIVRRLSELGYSRSLEKVRIEAKQIPTDLFWIMALEAGIRLEVHKPEYRKSVNYITNYVKLVELFTSYIIKLISNIVQRDTDTPLLICVDEMTTSAGKDKYIDASAAICDSFYQMRGDSYVTIPRTALYAVDSLTEFSELSEIFKNDKWFKDLLEHKKAAGLKAVVFDEFRKSGKTISLIKKILNLVGINLATSVVLLDFDPESRVDGDCALYEIPAKNIN